MSEKMNFIKDKRVLSVVWIIVFILAYYIFFAQWKVDLTFSAEDLKVRTIDNKSDFEDKIVRNIYDKIVESCEPEYDNRRYKDDVIWEGDFMEVENSAVFDWLKTSGISKWVSVNESIRTSWSADFWLSDSIWSIDFDWSEPETKVTQDVSFSQTNIQKQSVDEWDILKQTKDYIFYFSKTKSKIYTIKSPINWEEIDLNNIEAIHTINIPSNLTIKPELFVNEERLVYLASKKSYNNNNTIVWIYDISNLENREVKLHKIFETKWDYFKSRLIDNNLYLISDYSLAPFKKQFCNIINEEQSGIWEVLSFFTGVNFWSVWVNKELFDELKDELESYSFKFSNWDLNSNWSSEKLNDFKIFYSNKDLDEPIENLNFNIVSVVDIDKKDSDDSQSLVFWNLKNGEIHMTLDNLYLVNSYFQKEKWKCDYIDICYKEFSSNNFTSISKIAYSWKDLEYLKTSVIPWKPINQYSMDEDQWYFRIFTAHGSRNRDAALYVFNQKFKLIWEIEDIKPWEEFKSSRFIWDKAFLVTFRQKDPLFVIDLHIPADPKIIWELHIPWYSSYLHPYWKVGNKEYLIWIWQENRNVKVDLYEIDYDEVWLWDQISVKQKYKYIFNWNSSTSPAELNPRTFVWDTNDKLLYLPIKIETNSSYSNYEVWCEEFEPWCYLKNWMYVKREYKNKNFAWLKTLEIKIDSPIREIDSYNAGSSNIMDARVWYYKSIDDKASFFVEWGFIKFFENDNEKRVEFY